MHVETFYMLYRKIKRDLFQAISYSSKRKNAPNGRVHPTVRLACALRVFAGGDPLDIAVVFGVSRTVVYDSTKFVLQAVNACKELAIEFPEDHGKQQEIADGFRKKSKADIGNCVGCTDGMLVWLLCVTEKECNKVGVGSKKFFCGRKKRYGLNLQATCDHEKRFTNISISFPAATSDFLSFETSLFKMKLERPGFLAPGLCLFGDNAYINTPFMATPYTNVRVQDPRDAYNFFHSQIRINIECAFGILVSRWGILRRPMPQKYSIKKVISTVNCLCRIHNFLIDMRVQMENGGPPPSTAEDALVSRLKWMSFIFCWGRAHMV